MTAPTIAEFLLARISEDERRLDLPDFMEDHGSARGPGWGNRDECPVCGAYQYDGTESVTADAWWEHAETVHQRSRVLAECEAKRRIVERYVDNSPSVPNAYDLALLDVMRDLALPYADHPDYREEWKP